MANLSLRDVPEDLYQRIKEIADRQRRSVNQQIIVLLEQSLQQKRSRVEVLASIDQRNATIAKRVGITPDSAEMIAEDRQR
ncbi:Arc family DNA-binding protein [Gloeocapsopsis crepidinum LEGE 06123]|uniref:Arc family DNA-binding protein n=1 Tax=Gloeocapsopsis crepidinum LEGE 06123 TaxID=588587 RepID=A0ABR9UUG7_9CHRO|nr:Arc family DNA-binding protein [Gloeocapsopsis crepidinum]MBE9191932.1 Arc family DNA-binding protein [Gloeocapsopsis crepidinum LEGE 06123]